MGPGKNIIESISDIKYVSACLCSRKKNLQRLEDAGYTFLQKNILRKNKFKCFEKGKLWKWHTLEMEVYKLLVRF